MIKHLIVICLFVFCQQINAQKRIFFDKDWKITNEDNAKYYREINQNKDLYFITDFFITGEKQFEGKSTTKSEPLSLEGTAIWYNKNGTITQKASYVNNIPNGELKSFYSDGTLKVSQNYSDGKLNGVYTEFFPSGDISAQANFIFGKVDGLSIKYKSPGKLDYKVNYSNGILDGPYEFYNANNTLFTKGNSKNNSQEGFCQEFFYEGELRSQYTIRNRKLDGFYVEFNKNKDTVSIAHFSDGKPIDFSSQSLNTTNGSKFSAKMILDGNLENWSIYRDSNLIVKAFYENGVKTSLWSIYSFDGSKLLQTIDFGNKSDCRDKYIQETGTDFSPNFRFSERFRFDSRILDIKECENAIVKDIDDNFEKEHPFYYFKENKSNEVKEIYEKSNIVDYIDPSSKQEFISKNKCEKYNGDKEVMICIKEVDKIIHKVILSENVEKLKSIQSNVTPKSNEIYFFFQQIESRKYDLSKDKRPNRYSAFRISNILKEAFRDKTLDYISVIGVYEHQFWNVSDFSGLSAYEAYDKEMEEE